MEQKFQFEIAAILTEEIANVKKISDNRPTEQFTSCLVEETLLRKTTRLPFSCQLYIMEWYLWEESKMDEQHGGFIIIV